MCLPLYLVTTVELKHCGSWKLTVSVVLLLMLRRTTPGASGTPRQGQTGEFYSVCLFSALSPLEQVNPTDMVTENFSERLFGNVVIQMNSWIQ